MDTQDKPDSSINVRDLQQPMTPLLKSPLNAEMIRRLFQVTGGSSLYCLSAVFIAYGIVKLLKPILTGSESLRDALPCLLTLHGYELALLAVLLLIVFKKVVDDAVSLTILIGLFLVGTSIALGSVADRAIKAAMYFGLAGTVIGFVKLTVLRRFARIPFRAITLVFLTGIIAYNYLGPAFMARSVSVNAADEPARRGLWLLLYVLMLIGFLAVWLDAVRQKVLQEGKTSFLQSPAMASLFALIVLFGSGVHQYTMAYAFTLERVVLDYVPVVAVGCLVLLEVLRLGGKRNVVTDVAIASVPGVVTLYAIYNQSVLSSGHWGLGLLCYPPVMLAGIGAAVAGLAIYRKSYWLFVAVAAYGLGVIWTTGFSPEYPHDLNTMACGIVLVTALLVFGLVIRNPYVCLGAIILLCIGLPAMDRFSEVTKKWQLTEPGTLAGVLGFGTLMIYLIFKEKLPLVIRVFGALLLGAFVFDFLPTSMNIRDLIVVIFLGLLGGFLWIRTKDVLIIAILSIPVLIRIYILTKILANWRHIILGFAALLAGAWVSLFKHSIQDKTGPRINDTEGLNHVE